MAVFMNLRAFDSVDKEELIKGMRNRGIRESLVERVEEMLRETRSRIKVGSEVKKEFWTAKGVKQGRLLSLLLFNLLLADIEEEMEKVK